MTVFLLVFAAFGWWGYLRQSRKLAASRELADAYRMALTMEIEDHAKARAQFDQLSRLTARLVVASENLCDAQSPLIVPPSGGMVA
jgi:hypothetical protein